ncbi:EAL domain-containing protein [Aciduricibacillus chroicocephali]|uniref:EAL domain-containing protein n=1 Tax=Aciduricibacillus chroicocephali TaxID=3054939 RepID=A0ABY9KVH9_9BACI|nr:EAL domain-containing protein [Bacillaceae bacterium 44XB]
MKKRQFLIYMLLGFVLVGIFCFAYYNYVSTKNFVLDSVERETNEILDNFSTEVNRFSMERVAEIELIAEHVPHLMEKNNDIISFLSQQNKNMPFFTALGFITPEGKIQAADGTSFPVQQKESFKLALAGKTVFSDVFTLKQDPSQRVAAISTPIFNSKGEVIGVLSGVVNMSNLIGELVEDSNLAGTVYLLKNGEVLFTSNKKEHFTKSIPDSKQLLSTMVKIQKGSWTDHQNPWRFITYQHAMNNWVVLVDSETNPATDEISETLKFSIWLVAGTVIAIALISIYLIRLRRKEHMQTKLDLLTGLGNRVLLESNLSSKLAHSPERRITLFFIKLNRFTDLTERLGYQMSDRILYAVGKRLMSQDGRINVYRVGNEDFVLTSYQSTIQEQQRYADELLRSLEQPLQVDKNGPIWITVSIGIRSMSEYDCVNLVMQDAMFACHEAIKKGGNQIVRFTEQLAKDSEHQRLIANNLADALKNNEFYLLYQPIYSIKEDRIVSFETLMRWKSPVLGEVGPFHFIPLLEKSEAIIDVGRWLIREVAEQVLRWEKEGYDNFAVTLNVSIKQLQYEGFLSDVHAILGETGVRPERLIFEVTESIVAQNVKAAAQILQSLNEIGIKTAIDDFGTGYSSLSMLKSLPFQYMKVDRTFIIEVLNDNGESEAILLGLIEIANSLGLTTIMEGVETPEQLKILKQIGAKRIQGYLFSKPIPPEEAIKFLKKRNLLQSIIN